MTEESRARAEAAIREHVKVKGGGGYIDLCPICRHNGGPLNANWPCPTVLLARDILAGLEREKALATSARESFAALQLEVQERRSARCERDALRVKLEGVVEAVAGLIELQPESEYRDRLRAVLEKAKEDPR